MLKNQHNHKIQRVRSGIKVTGGDTEGEFLWLVSLSDLMILLFVFFVVLFSFSYQNMSSQALERASQIIRGEQTPTDMTKRAKKKSPKGWQGVINEIRAMNH